MKANTSSAHVGPIGAVFFDIGETLGELDANGKLVLYPDAKALLNTFHTSLGLRVGIITNAGSMTAEDVRSLLIGAGIDQLVESSAIVTSHDAGAPKPEPAIYRAAAERVGLAIQRCLFIGENTAEVDGAIQAGMSGVVRPRRQ